MAAKSTNTKTIEGKYSQENIKEIGRRVRLMRQSRKLSQHALADSIYVEKDVIYRIEAGKLKHINKDHLTNIATQLSCNPNYFLLKTDVFLTPDYSEAAHYVAPPFQGTAENFLYTHSGLKEDMDYMNKYMNTEFQSQIVSLIHTFVIYHQMAVHYPNVNPDEAKAFTLKKAMNVRKENFFANQNTLSDKSNWTYPKKKI